MAKPKMMQIPVKQYDKLFTLVEKMADQVEAILVALEALEVGSSESPVTDDEGDK